MNYKQRYKNKNKNKTPQTNKPLPLNNNELYFLGQCLIIYVVLKKIISGAKIFRKYEEADVKGKEPISIRMIAQTPQDILTSEQLPCSSSPRWRQSTPAPSQATFSDWQKKVPEALLPST